MGVLHPSLYQVNTRLLLSRISKPGKRAGLSEIPAEYWHWLRSMGMDYVWLMGVWNTNEIGFEVERQDWEITKYTSILPDLREEDLRGSPYAIDRYILDPQMGEMADLATLKGIVNKAGLKLILDFVPNHFGAHSELIRTHPEVFMQGTEVQMEKYPGVFFKHASGGIFAHGKDPNFDPWMDTVQVDYRSSGSRAFIRQALVDVAAYCDGLRCDMSMLLQKHVFRRTWGFAGGTTSFSDWETPFWPSAINVVREDNPDFIFIAECYWSMEQEMLDHGFDYTYDKALLDKMINGNVHAMKWHLGASADYQNRSVRFLENHDEEPVQTTMHQEKHFAASVLVAHMPGMRFYHGGQWEGKRTLVPVQLRRRPNEPVCRCLLSGSLDRNWKNTILPGMTEINCLCTWMHYQLLLKKTNTPILKKGDWAFIEFRAGMPGNDSHEQLFGYVWRYRQKQLIVIVNFSGQAASGVFAFPGKDLSAELPAQGDGYLVQLRPYRYLRIQP